MSSIDDPSSTRSLLRLRVVGLGDSTTAGTPGFLSPIEAPPNGIGNPESQYTYWMMEIHPEWTVLNRGINGQRSDQILARFQRDVVEEHPDCAIILAGVNDVYERLPTESVKRNLLTMYRQSLAQSIMPVAATVLPYNTASDSQSDVINELNHWIQETARQIEILFCDTNRAVADPRNPRRLLSSPDVLHPEISGYRRIGEALVKVIEQHFLRIREGK